MNTQEKEDLKLLIKLTKEYIWILETDHGYELEVGKEAIKCVKNKYLCG